MISYSSKIHIHSIILAGFVGLIFLSLKETNASILHYGNETRKSHHSLRWMPSTSGLVSTPTSLTAASSWPGLRGSADGKNIDDDGKLESIKNRRLVPGDVSLTIVETPTTVSYSVYYHTRYELNPFPNDDVDHLAVSWRANVLDGGWSGWKFLGQDENYNNYLVNENQRIWWTPPDYYASALAQLKIEAMATDNNVLATVETEEFLVQSLEVILLKPNGGVSLVAGSSYTIEWIYTENPWAGFDLEYTTDGVNWNWIPKLCTTDCSTQTSFLWTVPDVTTETLRVRVTATEGEFDASPALDESDGDNRIVASGSAAINLVQPNPTSPGGIIMVTGEQYDIEYTATGTENIKSVVVCYTLDSGDNWVEIEEHTSTLGNIGNGIPWYIPEAGNGNDFGEGKVKLVMTPSLSGSQQQIVISNHPFYIYQIYSPNRPPVAIAGEDIVVQEHGSFVLDGSASFDQDGDELTFNWEVQYDNGLTSTCNRKVCTMHTVSLSRDQYAVATLTVSDGNVAVTDTTRIYLVAAPPTINEVDCLLWYHGWAGTYLAVRGEDLKNAKVSLGLNDNDFEFVGFAPEESDALPGFEDRIAFVLIPMEERLPAGVYETVKVEKSPCSGHEESSCSSIIGQPFEVHPDPSWQYQYALGFENPSKESLSWDGPYYKNFGEEQLYLHAYYWSPSKSKWVRYRTLKRLSAIVLYEAAFEEVEDEGACFGMSVATLQFYREDFTASDFKEGAESPSDLDNPDDTLVRELVDWRHGSQLAAEISGPYVDSLFFTSTQDVVADIKRSIETQRSIEKRNFGICSLRFQHGKWGAIDDDYHAVVPYDIRENEDEIRIYVYDSNSASFSSLELARRAAENNKFPKHIAINKDTWSLLYRTHNFGGPLLDIGFSSPEHLFGPRTLLTSHDGIGLFLFGTAVQRIEDDSGNQFGVTDSDEFVNDIQGASIVPKFTGGHDLLGWKLPPGTSSSFTVELKGNVRGPYEFVAMYDSTLAPSKTLASMALRSSDSVVNDQLMASYEDKDPLKATYRYKTKQAGHEKTYTASILHEYVLEQVTDASYPIFASRKFSLTSTLVSNQVSHRWKKNPTSNGILFTNEGMAQVEVDVEFSTNFARENIWGDEDPWYLSLKRVGMTVNPYQTVDIHIPEDEWWNNLQSSKICSFPPQDLACPDLSGTSPPNFPLELTIATAESCVELTVVDYQCRKRDKTFDPNCKHSISGSTLTIEQSRGVGTTHSWTIHATDDNGNAYDMDCSFAVTRK